MHAAGIPIGEGVSPRFTRRPKGQSTVEYVLIVAIIALVILIAGPWVSSAIRNQFNLVSETLGEGTSGIVFKDPVDIPDARRGTAFAVYSEDDHSLMFYKRRGIPKVGDMFNDRRVTEVYTGFESETYVHHSGESWKTWTTNVPWSSLESKIAIAEAVDEGIQPKSIAFWFYRCTALETVDLSKMDLSKVELAHGAFLLCRRLSSVSLSPFSSKLREMQDFITCCDTLKELDLSTSDLSKVTSFYHFALNDGHASLETVRFPTDPNKQPKLVFDMSCMFSNQLKLKTLEGFGEAGWGIGRKDGGEVDLSNCFQSCISLKLDCSKWNVTAVTKHYGFNHNAPGIIAPKWVD